MILAAALNLSACGSEAPERIAAEDPWFNAPSNLDIEIEAVAQSAYYPVAPERLEEAEQTLERIAISQISPGEASYFAGRPVAMPDVSRPYLIRGLYRSEPSFFVRIIGNALWVGSHDDPRDSAPMRRQPLVLIMDEVPEQIYVTAGE